MMPLHDLTLAQAAEKLRKKEISSLELTRACLQRTAETEPKLDAFLTVTAEHAEAAAKKIDERRSRGEALSLLAGVPFALKDIFLTRGIKTTCASKILHNFIPPYTATSAQKLFDGGIVLTGKLNMDEFAMGIRGLSGAGGRVGNAYDTRMSPGGSSSGSGVAVGAGFVPLALGSDNCGSLRIPAVYNGAVALRPTPARWPKPRWTPRPAPSRPPACSTSPIPFPTEPKPRPTVISL